MAQDVSSPASAAGANQPVDATASTCKEKRVIVIDPGHGGTKKVGGSSPNNAVAASGVLEKRLTLEYAQVLQTHLESEAIQQIFRGKGYCEVKIILTRTTDVNVGISDRVKVARVNKADIFLSIHFNGANKKARGTETYYRDPKNGSQSNKAQDEALAKAVNDATFGAIAAIDSGAKNRGVKADSQTGHKKVGVLADPGIGLSGKMCRSALVEIEFIDVPAVDAILVTGADANRSSVMLAVARALANTL
ncbi:MAG TPA: N-acetylmuramoyl-L-alanine amidase [Polyangium sp.]|jgi:N-acetylmuramoyl-L-alanine amidase|nr:N-acetylmuramoyl-L-alanine amidase [Polyangium sp.]